MSKWKYLLWDLDGTEKVEDLWNGDPEKILRRHQTIYGIAYEQRYKGQWYYATRKRFGNTPYWEKGTIPYELISPDTFFPSEDCMDDIVALEDTDDLIFSRGE